MNQIDIGPDARAALGRCGFGWTMPEILGLFRLPFSELVFTAQSIHRRHFDPAQVQFAQLLSIKTGGCPEDCGYCSPKRRITTPA